MSTIYDRGYVLTQDIINHCGPRILPEQAWREVCNENDPSDDPKYGEYLCSLECRDEPAFRQGVVEHADAMERDHEWVTFNNGETYYEVRKIKEFLTHYPVNEYDYCETLLRELEFLL